MTAFGGTAGTILLLAACSASFKFALCFLNYIGYENHTLYA
jgi:hypothetical protein